MQGLTLPGAPGTLGQLHRKTFISPLVRFQLPSVPGQQAGGPLAARSGGPTQLAETVQTAGGSAHHS